MSFDPKWEEFVSKSINLKNKSKTAKYVLTQRQLKEAAFLRAPFPKPRNLLLLSNHKQEDNQGVRLHYQPPHLHEPEPLSRMKVFKIYQLIAAFLPSNIPPLTNLETKKYFLQN